MIHDALWICHDGLWMVMNSLWCDANVVSTIYGTVSYFHIEFEPNPTFPFLGDKNASNRTLLQTNKFGDDAYRISFIYRVDRVFSLKTRCKVLITDYFIY